MALITGTARTLTVQWGNYDCERYGPIYLQVGSDEPALQKLQQADTKETYTITGGREFRFRQTDGTATDPILSGFMPDTDINLHDLIRSGRVIPEEFIVRARSAYSTDLADSGDDTLSDYVYFTAERLPKPVSGFIYRNRDRRGGRSADAANATASHTARYGGRERPNLRRDKLGKPTFYG